MSTTHFSCYKNFGYTAFPHFTSEKFGMTVLMKVNALLVKLFYKHFFAPIALQKFRTLKDMKKGVGLMITMGLVKMIQEFEKSGSFDEQSFRKRIDLTSIDEVATAIQDESSGGLQPCSVRGNRETLDWPPITVHKILQRILHCYPYKIGHV